MTYVSKKDPPSINLLYLAYYSKLLPNNEDNFSDITSESTG